MGPTSQGDCRESISWELAFKPVYYIHNTTSFILVESIFWELALKLGYYTIIVQYTFILSVRGITVFRAHIILARGRHPLPRSSVHLKSRPGKAPTYRALPSRPKSTPPPGTGFREHPREPAWPQGNSLHEIQVSAGQFTQYQIITIQMHVCSLEAPETNWLPFRVTAGFVTSLGGNSHNNTRLLGQPESTYCGL